jgi:hypothetical protein
MGIRLSILLLAVCSGAHAAEVLRVGKDMTNIAVSHDTNRTWSVNDRVCILQHAREVGCGVVLKTTGKGAIVRLDAPSYDILAGDRVVSKFQSPAAVAAPVQKQRAVQQQAPQGAPLMNSVGDNAESEIHNFNFSGGVGVGTSFFYPTISAQIAVAPTIAIGFTGTFFTYSNSSLVNTTLMAFGGMATVNYYSQEYFRGLWVQAGGGVTFFSVNGTYGSESASSLTGIATVGWRGYWDLGLNIGVGAGFQYTSTPVFNSITVNAAGFQPLLVLDVGFSLF